jgi:hypothetical protein
MQSAPLDGARGCAVELSQRAFVDGQSVTLAVLAGKLLLMSRH